MVCTHLILLVPGTGPQTEDDKPKGAFMKKAQKFRQMVHDACRRDFPLSHVELRTIHYYSSLHSLSTANPRMDQVTLPSIPWIRTLGSGAIGDILYYFSTFHGRQMLLMVTKKLNEAYRQFLQDTPGFKGPVSLVAHSLGGLVCYEILCYMSHAGAQWEKERYQGLPPLDFVPDRLFALGSPLGGAMVFRNLSPDNYLVSPVGYHNIFHPYDPFGYRTEPLVDDSYADAPAVPITVSQQEASSPMFAFKHARRASSFAGSVADLGRTFSSSILKAAKTSIMTMPINAVAASRANAHRGSVASDSFFAGKLMTHFRRSFSFNKQVDDTQLPTPDSSDENSSDEFSSHTAAAIGAMAATQEQAKGAEDSIDDDDMIRHLVRILSPTRPPTKEQELAESQGLPLSSRLLSANLPPRPHTQGSQLRKVPLWTPYSVAGEQLLSKPRRPTTSPSMSSISSTDEDIRLRRTHTVPRQSAALVEDPRLAASDQGQTSESPALTPVPTNNTEEAGEGDILAKLPYTERMDYIIPFTKRHLHNEYWLGFNAHFSYWTSKDVVHHILYHMINKPLKYSS